MRLGLVLANVVQVVGHDERQSRLRGEAQQLFVEPALFRQAVVLQLQEEAILAEDVAVLAGELAGQLPVVGFERLRDLAAEAGGQPDQPLTVAGEMVAIDARLVIVAVDVGVGDEPAEVPVADEILGQQDQMEGLGVGLALLVGHRPAGDIGLHADDRLDALGPGRLVERDRAIQRAVVRDGHRIHALLRRRIDQLRDPAEAVEQAELGVHVEVREVVRSEGRQGMSMVARRKRVRRGLQIADHIDAFATIISDAMIPAESDLLEHPERRRVPCPDRRPQTASTRRGGGIHEGSCRFRRIAVPVKPLEQLEGDLRFVQAATPHDQRAVADRVALRATTDRESTDADLCRQIPESRQARRRLLERRGVLPTFSDQLAVPLGVALVAEPKR